MTGIRAAALALCTLIEGVLPTVDPSWKPVSPNASYFNNLFNVSFGIGNLDDIDFTAIAYWLVAPITDSFKGGDALFIILFGLPALMLYWRTKKAIYPFILVILISPFALWILPTDIREGIIVLLVASIAGLIYQLWVSIKKQ